MSQKQHYCVVLGQSGVGKSSFLNALFKNYNIDIVLETSKGGSGCTKEIQPYPIDIGDDKFILIDTPGLNDPKLEEKTKEALRAQATKSNNRIKVLLICLHIDDERFHTSIEEMLKEFMNCFPLKDFWKHVFIIRTHVRSEEDKEYGNLESSIKEYLGNFMEEKGINYPKNMNDREFFFNSVIGPKSKPKINTGNDIKNEFKKVLEMVKSIDPLFEEIKYLKDETKDEGNFNVTYSIYEYKDFNGKIFSRPVEKYRQFKVKQVGKTGPFRGKKYLGKRTDCWGNEFSVYQDYNYYKDEKGFECDCYDVGDEYEV